MTTMASGDEGSLVEIGRRGGGGARCKHTSYVFLPCLTTKSTDAGDNKTQPDARDHNPEVDSYVSFGKVVHGDRTSPRVVRRNTHLAGTTAVFCVLPDSVGGGTSVLLE